MIGFGVALLLGVGMKVSIAFRARLVLLALFIRLLDRFRNDIFEDVFTGIECMVFLILGVVDIL